MHIKTFRKLFSFKFVLKSGVKGKLLFENEKLKYDKKKKSPGIHGFYYSTFKQVTFYIL